MFSTITGFSKWRIALMSALLLVASICATSAIASKPTDSAVTNLQAPGTTAHTDKAAPSAGNGESARSAPETQDAFMLLQPGTTAGTCAAPANGGSVNVGCTFVLDLIINTGSNSDTSAQQSYLTFNNN